MSALISIIVPVYNEAGTVATVLERLLTIDLPASREIIVVNDGSQDGTRDVLDQLARRNPSISVIHADRNRGKGAALRLGFARSQGTVVAVQDADLELDPAQLSLLVEPVLRGEANVVYGSRFLDGSSTAPAMTRVANRALTVLTNALYGSALTDMETCYKVIRGDIIRGLRLHADRFDVEPEITIKLLKAGHRIIERPVTFSARSKAAGKKIRWRDGVHAIGMLLKHRLVSR